VKIEGANYRDVLLIMISLTAAINPRHRTRSSRVSTGQCADRQITHIRIIRSSSSSVVRLRLHLFRYMWPPDSPIRNPVD